MANVAKRISKTGKVFYQVQIRRAGYSPISQSFDKLAEARNFAATTEAKLLKNEQVNMNAIKHTIHDVIAQFLEQNQDIPNKHKTRLKYLQHKDELGNFSVKTLTPSMLNKWIVARLVFNKPPTVYWYYCNLKKAMLWHALHNDYRQDLFQLVKCSTTVTARNRRFTDDEIKKMYQAMDEHMTGKTDEMKWAFEFACNTAMRAGEMLAFRWKDTDLENQYVKLDAKITKTGTSRDVPLTTDALQILQAIKARHYKDKPEERVFGFYTDTRHLSRQFKIISLWAGIPDLLWHYTRGEATSRFYEKTRLTDVEIASITGHKDINVLAKHYAHLRHESLREKLW